MIFTNTYAAPPINRREILRYAGIRNSTPELDELLQSCLDEIEGRITYRVCYGEFDLNTDGDLIDMGFATVRSSDLAKNLHNCEKIVLFAATVGVEMDRIIAKHTGRAPSRAVMLQAIGSERVESLCNLFNSEISQRCAEQGIKTHPRFSPGYGDLSLELQRDIFAVLECPKRIGASLNHSLLISPSKSVTAIIGMENKE